MTSSITFNVGAPTFLTVAHPFRGEEFHCVDTSIQAAPFPFWNDALPKILIALKTKSLGKPSSITLNVGAPTFSEAHPFRGRVFRNAGNVVPDHRTPSGLKGLSYKLQHHSRGAVSQ
jgi:hypothetical protein